MAYYKFDKSDIFHNIVEAYPKYDIFIYDSKTYINNKNAPAGKFAAYVGHVPPGHINLNELNIDRPSDSLVYPFVVKGSSLNSIASVGANFASSFQYGDIISGSYPLSASIITRERYATGQARPRITALRTTFAHYSTLNPHCAYSSSFAGDKSTEELNLLSIPSIFFGSSIRKGSIDLKFYVSGTLIGQLQDPHKDGTLIQTGPAGSKGSGSVAGVALYNEGFVVLTGSWDLTANGHPHTEQYVAGSSAESPAWVYFAVGANDDTTTGQIHSSSFTMVFEGTNYIPTITMLAHAPLSELNFSSNQTFALQASSSAATTVTSSVTYKEQSDVPIKNIISSSYIGYEEDFQKQTYISKIGLYDENRNLIAIAKLATPIRKKESDSYTFKLKLDI